MMWVVALCLAAAWCGVSAQPISCYSDNECGEGYYCERSAQKCFECLRCSDVKKEAPSNLELSVCVKSFVDCGPCLKGLVVDNRGDVNAGCVSPESQQQDPVLPVYLWVLIGLAIVIGILLTVGLYLYRKPETFKVWASTSIRSLFERPAECQSATDLPPPYNPNYNYVPNPNLSYAPPPDMTTHLDEDTAQPFVKRAPTSQPQDAREAADNQMAKVFNRPAYSYEDDDSISSPEPTEDSHGKYSVSSPLMVQEEETMASLWEPYEHDTNDAENNNVMGATRAAGGTDETEGVGEAVSAALVPVSVSVPVPVPVPMPMPAASDLAIGPPAAKRTRTAGLQDTNNNRSRDSSAGSSSSSSSVNQQTPADNQTSVFINVVINNTK